MPRGRIGDWFERLPPARRDPQREQRAMDIFSRYEAELRQAGGRLLRRFGHRSLVLAGALEATAAS